MEGRIYAAPTEEPQEGYGAGFRRGEGTPPYARFFKWGCRAASPLAAVEFCGGGKVPGRDMSAGNKASSCKADGKWRKMAQNGAKPGGGACIILLQAL